MDIRICFCKLEVATPPRLTPPVRTRANCNPFKSKWPSIAADVFHTATIHSPHFYGIIRFSRLRILSAN